MLLGWDSTPVPGPDGRIVCEIYEFPYAYLQRYQAVSLYQTVPGKGTTVSETFIEPPLVDHAPLLKEISRDPIKPLQWLIATAPFIKDLLPKRYRYWIDGSTVIVVSVTLDEWKRLQSARNEDIAPLAYLLHFVD